jgi:hypothetical protein
MAPNGQQLAAVARLWEHANGASGQCRHTAAFLLGLYDGFRFPFDLTNFRRLDADLFADCLLVLTMNYAPDKEVHRVLGVDGKKFELLAQCWDILPVTKPLETE